MSQANAADPYWQWRKDDSQRLRQAAVRCETERARLNDYSDLARAEIYASDLRLTPNGFLQHNEARKIDRQIQQILYEGLDAYRGEMYNNPNPENCIRIADNVMRQINNVLQHYAIR